MDSAGVVRQYYRLVDDGTFPELLALFAEEITYARGTRALLRGKEALRRFYEHERLIRSGVHRLVHVVSESDSVIVEGTFVGKLKSGEDVEVAFEDRFTFDASGHIVFRTTTFPGREV